MNKLDSYKKEITDWRVLKSRIEASTLKKRDLRCPNCGFRIQTLYSDARGHLQTKCPKCKGIFIFNVAYFRRMKDARKYCR